MITGIILLYGPSTASVGLGVYLTREAPLAILGILVFNKVFILTFFVVLSNLNNTPLRWVPLLINLSN